MTVCHRLQPFGTTIFAEMSALAIRHSAVNLSQGFPDFDGPQFIKDAVADAMGRDGWQGHNQYARLQGIPPLNNALAAWWKKSSGQEVDPDAQITVTSGCTEGLAATFLGLLNPGDEVILFEPYYDSYRACIAMAGGVPKFITLHTPEHSTRHGLPSEHRRHPAFTFDPDQLRTAITPRTRAIVINTPHNPTGKVFTRDELSLIADLCNQHNLIAITDEVYERLTFDDDLPHLHIATFPGMAERTISISSFGKTFSLTGWKVGWCIASPELSRAVRAAHQFLTFCIPTPLQHGAAAALTHGEESIRDLVTHLRASRDFLGAALERIGFGVHWPAGTYFIMADHTPISGGRSDVEFCRWLTSEIGIATIPPSCFYNNPALGRPLVRFAFCKKHETLAAAVERLERLANR